MYRLPRPALKAQPRKELRRRQPRLPLQRLPRTNQKLKRQPKARRCSPLVKINRQYQLIGERSLKQRDTAGLRILMKTRSQKSGVSSQKKTNPSTVVFSPDFRFLTPEFS